jgi:Protein of unknown function (DUF2958)
VSDRNLQHYTKWNRSRRHMWVTKDIAARMPDLYANEAKKPEDIPVVLKLFNPTGAGTWYLTEADLDEGVAFGYCVIHEGELGYVSLRELREYKGVFGLGIERDEGFDGATLADVMVGRAA